jgi:PHP domain
VFRLFGRVVVLAVAALVLLAALPTAPRGLPPLAEGLKTPIRGVIHVHTNRSDGTASVEDVLRSAAQAGLQFVIVTDHGDTTSAPDLPDYRNGVLYIDAVEISTRSGHVIALGLPKAPYPLAGEGRDVVEDIHRLGGIAIAAHPGSPKPELRWTDWDIPLDGVEWLNADSEWRDERAWTLARALVTYPFRPPQALGLLLDRPEPVLRQWDALTQRHRVSAVAASDAHARVGVRSLGEPYDSAGSLHFPSYANSFREFSIALSDTTLTGDAETDARRVIDAIRAGHVYSTVDALGGPAAMRFVATSGSRTASMGDALPVAGPVHVHVDAQAPAEATITLFRDGTSVATARGGRLDHDASEGPAVYRVEIGLPDAPGTPKVPWVLSNPVYVGRGADNPVTPPRAAPRNFMTVYDGGPARGWRIEKADASDAAMDVIGALGGTQLLLRFAISGTAAQSPYVAFVMPATGTIAMYERLVFTARANRPMRLSVQLRAPGGEGERWSRSVYLDSMPRTVDVAFNDFRPLGSTSTSRPELSKIDSILYVVDTTNTKAGSNGEIQVDDIRYAR